MENGNWCVKGEYKDIVEDIEDEDEVEWSYTNEVPNLIMCLVSSQDSLISYHLAM
jgi:hypothetical protein